MKSFLSMVLVFDYGTKFLHNTNMCIELGQENYYLLFSIFYCRLLMLTVVADLRK